MGRDYAHQRGGRRKMAGQPPTPGWVWLLVGVAIGAVGAAGYYVSRPLLTEAASAPTRATTPADVRDPEPIAMPPREKPRFDFYKLLPSYEVVVPRETLEPKPDTPRPPPVDGASYVIQAGSFRQRVDADAQKAALAMIGLESRVEPVTIDRDQTWYRVRIGPESDAARLRDLLAQLDDNGVDALVMRVVR